MGASGAGKTTLLSAIADRVREDRNHIKTGSVLINNGESVNQKTFGAIASFVMQDDILFDFLKVKEALTFAARLRLSTLSSHE